MKKLISLFAIVSLLVLSMSSCKRSSSDIICDGDFCYWQRYDTNNYYRFNKNGIISSYYQDPHHQYCFGENAILYSYWDSSPKIYKNYSWDLRKKVWSVHNDSLCSDFFSGRIVLIRDTLVILENADEVYIFKKVDKHSSTFSKLKAARKPDLHIDSFN